MKRLLYRLQYPFSVHYVGHVMELHAEKATYRLPYPFITLVTPSMELHAIMYVTHMCLEIPTIVGHFFFDLQISSYIW